MTLSFGSTYSKSGKICLEYIMIFRQLGSGESYFYSCPYSLLPGNKINLLSDLDARAILAMQKTVGMEMQVHLRAVGFLRDAV